MNKLLGLFYLVIVIAFCINAYDSLIQDGRLDELEQRIELLEGRNF